MLEAIRRKLRTAPLILLRVVAVCFVLFVGSRYLTIAFERIAYPGELEWMEGGVLHHVRRVTQGMPLYVRPSVDFTAYIYPPFYYWLCAALSLVFGLSIQLLRAVSFVSFLVTLGLIVFWTKKRTKSVWPGLLGAGLFSATFRLGGAWFDIARSDSLLVALLMGGALLLLEYRGQRSAIAAGVLLALACFTKQSGLLPTCALVGWALLMRETRYLWFAGVATGLVLSIGLILQLSSGGWFSYYVLTLPASHPLIDDWIVFFWTRDVLGVLAIGSLLLCFVTLSRVTEEKRLVPGLGFVAFVMGVLGQVWSSRFHVGMYDNVLMPWHALLGLGVALCIGKLARRQSPTEADRAAWEAACLLGIFGVVYNLQFKLEPEVPTEAHYEQHRSLLEKLEKLPEDTWIPFHSHHAALSGFDPRAHWMAMIDVQRGGGEPAKQLKQDAARFLNEQRTQAIVWSINDPTTEWFHEDLRRNYQRRGRIHGPSPLTGWRQRPTEIWRPKPRKPRAKNTEIKN